MKREQMGRWLKRTARRAVDTAAVWRNPVVVRDLRVRMRGKRAYQGMGLYLAALGLLALAGYNEAASSGTGTDGLVSATAIQFQLRLMYSFIFMTLAGLVSLVAPALTSASVTAERQRQTLDLLVTTPLTSSELLVGKLVSSTAFLALLLALSLPASALCVVLGGATMGDVFRVYALLLVDGLVLAALGLYFSAQSRNSIQAIISSYGAMFVAFWASIPVLIARSYGGVGPSSGGIFDALALLNPFYAVEDSAGAVPLFGVSVPLWTITVAAAFLIIRFLVTAATYAMGSYGGDALGSLRRQILLYTGLLAVLSAYSYAVGVGGAGAVTVALTGDAANVFAFAVVVIVGASLFLAPNLFTPVAPEEARPGVTIGGNYDIRRAFQPSHAGSLPYYHLWLGTLFLGLLLGFVLGGYFPQDVVDRLMFTALYSSGLGYLAWCVARRAASLVAGMTGARATAFAFLFILAAFPPLLVALAETSAQQEPNPFFRFWIFYPLTQSGGSDPVSALLISTALCYGVGTLFYPPWRKAALSRRYRAPATAPA